MIDDEPAQGSRSLLRPGWLGARRNSGGQEGGRVVWGDGLGAEGDEVGVVGGGEGVDGLGGGEGLLAGGLVVTEECQTQIASFWHRLPGFLAIVHPPGIAG